jgi:GNAT superfamily N-acetyltransferase
MIIRSLSKVSPIELHSTFNLAFSDYPFTVEETLQELIISNLHRGVDYSASFGSFTEDNRLTGFILCGVRNVDGKTHFYDGATAVIPSHRGKGIATLLLEKAVEEARLRKAHSFTLEVLQENQKAKRLYEKQGFVVSRTLRCIQKKVTDIPSETTQNEDIYSPDIHQFFKIIETLPLSYNPSWQNSYASIATLFDSLDTKVLYHGNVAVGYIVFDSKKGAICQIAAQENSPSILYSLIIYAKNSTTSKSLKFINLERNSPLVSILENDGWTFLTDQFEMIKYF